MTAVSCDLAATSMPGKFCEFALCTAEPEYLVATSPTAQPMLVCALHVTPATTWGVADVSQVSIRPLFSDSRG